LTNMALTARACDAYAARELRRELYSFMESFFLRFEMFAGFRLIVQRRRRLESRHLYVCNSY
jgi:hypothetical protein